MFWRWSTCTRTKPSHLNSPQLLWSPLLLVSHKPQRYFYSYFFLQNFFIYIFFNLEKILGKLWLYCHGSDQSLKKAKKSLGNYSSTLLSPLLRNPKPKGKRRINWYKEPKRNSSKRINWSSIIFLKKIESFTRSLQIEKEKSKKFLLHSRSVHTVIAQKFATTSLLQPPVDDRWPNLSKSVSNGARISLSLTVLVFFFLLPKTLHLLVEETEDVVIFGEIKLTFSRFKQYFIFFYPHIFQNFQNNNSQITLPNNPIEFYVYLFGKVDSPLFSLGNEACHYAYPHTIKDHTKKSDFY